MNQLFIVLAQSNTLPVLIFILLLLVAGIIGYITAWFYARSVYTPVIKGLEEDKSRLEKKVLNQADEISKLKESVNQQKDRIHKLDKELADRDKEIKKLKDKKG